MVAAGNKAKALRRSTVPQKQFLLLIKYEFQYITKIFLDRKDLVQ